MNSIIIFSLEGIHSNTEVNFFRGLMSRFYYDCYAMVIPIGRYGCDAEEEALSKFYARIDAGIMNQQKLFDKMNEEGKNIHVFFVGDKDRDEHMAALNCSLENAVFYMQNRYQHMKFYKSLIGVRKKSLDDVLFVKYTVSNHKRFERTDLFDVWYKQNFREGGDVMTNLLNFFKDTAYTVILQEIMRKGSEKLPNEISLDDIDNKEAIEVQNEVECELKLAHKKDE